MSLKTPNIIFIVFLLLGAAMITLSQTVAKDSKHKIPLLTTGIVIVVVNFIFWGTGFYKSFNDNI